MISCFCSHDSQQRIDVLLLCHLQGCLYPNLNPDILIKLFNLIQLNIIYKLNYIICHQIVIKTVLCSLLISNYSEKGGEGENAIVLQELGII